MQELKLRRKSFEKKKTILRVNIAVEFHKLLKRQCLRKLYNNLILYLETAEFLIKYLQKMIGYLERSFVWRVSKTSRFEIYIIFD